MTNAEREQLFLPHGNFDIFKQLGRKKPEKIDRLESYVFAMFQAGIYLGELNEKKRNGEIKGKIVVTIVDADSGECLMTGN